MQIVLAVTAKAQTWAKYFLVTVFVSVTTTIYPFLEDPFHTTLFIVFLGSENNFVVQN